MQGSRMNRRQFLVGALSTAPLCSRCAVARSVVNGCRTLATAIGVLGEPLPRRTAPRIEDSGSIMDTTMWFEDYRTMAQNDFGVAAALCFYDDSEGMNAMAMPDPLFPDGPDGTVLMGDNLTRLEWRREPIIPLGPFNFSVGGAWQSVEIIVAHEYAHILQYKKGLPPNGPWEMEPHADFMAGWLLGVKMERMVKFYGQDIGSFRIEEGAKSMFQKGDTLFNDRQHHGEPQLRAAMVHGGFNARKANVTEAFELGRSMAGLK
jgi:hypothetical protein